MAQPQSIIVCDQCLKTFVYEGSFRNHKCKGVSGIKTCQLCNKMYINPACFDKHSKICAERKKWMVSKKGDGNKEPAVSPKYQCNKCSKHLVRHKCRKDNNSRIKPLCFNHSSSRTIEQFNTSSYLKNELC